MNRNKQSRNNENSNDQSKKYGNSNDQSRKNGSIKNHTRNRREEIVYATLDLAAEHGLGTVSMQQIATRVGITKASLYNHFSSKEEIVEAMYEVLRRASKEKAVADTPDFDRLTPEVPLSVILSRAVSSYRSMVSDPAMFRFYKVIMSERAINPAAAEIMVKETRTMIHATKALFYALQVKGIADFEDVDAAALSFAMAVHSIIDYECDLLHAAATNTPEEPAHDSLDLAKANPKAPDLMQEYINEFSRIYGGK